jgi:hypothetical protein
VPPTPPIYLIREQVDDICRSKTFDPQDLLQRLLRFIVEQTIAEMKTTEGILAMEFWQDDSLDKTKVRTNVGRLRKTISAYYGSADALAAIVIISVPPAGLDANTRQFSHYSATFEFHPAMLKSSSAFAQVLLNKYGLPLSDGERWFTERAEPLELLRAVIHQHKSAALLLKHLHYSPEFARLEHLFDDSLACYDIAQNILNCIKPTARRGDIRTKLAVPYISEIVHSADTIVNSFAGFVSGRIPLTTKFQEQNERAMASVQYAFDRFLEGVEANLLPTPEQLSGQQP